MTSQRRQQIIAINILPTISRSNGNQAIIKRGPKEYFSLKIVQKIRQGDMYLFLFFKKALYKVKASGQHLSFNIFWQTLAWTYNKSKLYNTSNC